MKTTDFIRLPGILYLFMALFACSSDDSTPIEEPQELDDPIETEEVLEGASLLFEIDENPANGSEIGTVPSPSDNSFSYRLISSDPEGALEVDPQSGAIRVLDSAFFDYEQRTSLLARAQVTDGSLTVNHPVEIQILDVDERYSYFGTKWLTTQAEVDRFGAEEHWGVSGVLYIRNSTSDPVVNLAPLSSIRAVGTLYINNLPHRSIELPNIEYIEEDFRIENTRDLLRVDNLSIPYIGGDLIVQDNAHLESLEGLDLEVLGGGLIVVNNPRLASLEGVIMDRIEGNLQIERNNALSEITGLENLDHVGGNLRIAEMFYLRDLDGLDALRSIGGNLSIQDNPLLKDFCALNGLVQNDGLNGSYQVSGNEYDPTLQQLQSGECSF